MKIRKILLSLAVLLTLFGCSRDPNVAKVKYLESGNKYFENAKYKQASIMYRKALSKDLRYGEAYYRLGLAELQLKNWNSAVKALRRAVELQPENEDAFAKLGDLYMTAYLSDPRRPQSILTEIRELADENRGLLKRNPDSFHGLRLMGFVALVEKDVPRALQLFKRANEVRPRQPDVVLTYAQALTASNNWPEAEKLALDLVANQPQFPPVYDLLYSEYARRGRPADAEAILRKKADNNPNQVGYLVQLAGHYFAAHQEQKVTETLDRIVNNKEDFPNGRINVGDFYSNVKQFDKAIKNYEEGMRSAPDDKAKAEYQKHLVVAYVAQNRKKEALDLVEQVLKINPKDPDALSMRASLALQGGSREQIQSAVNDLNAVVAQRPDNFVVRYEAGRANLAKGDIEQARTQFQEAIKLRSDYIPPKLALGRIYLARRDFAKALQSASEILAIAPTNASAKLLRTSALIGSGDVKSARVELEALVKERPDGRDAQFQLAMLNFSERRFKEAEDIFTRLNKENPADPRGFMGIVETHMSQGRPAQALSMLQDAVRKSPDRADYRLAMANVAVRAGNLDMAVAEYGKLLEKNPQSPDVHLRLGETYRRRGDMDSAIKHFAKAKELSPNDPVASVQLAMMLEGTGKREEAKPIYEQILKVDPENAIALNNLAFMLADNGTDLDQALTFAQRAKQKFPANPEIADTLGWVYIKKNLSDNAISIFRDLTAKQPNNATYQYHLGLALFQKGEKPEAKKALEAALRNKPSKQEETKIRELIGRIG
jgi:tetratricopeptide (TPR) repeat protein